MLGEEIALIQNQLRDDMRAEIDGLEREIEALRSRLGEQAGGNIAPNGNFAPRASKKVWAGFGPAL